MAPLETNISLQDLFQQENDPQWFIHEHFPIDCDVPEDREPEFGVLLERMETARQIEEELINHPNIKQIGEHIPHSGLLVSLPQDTVGEDGYPLRQIEELGLENRRRVNLNPSTGILTRFDVSFKSQGKGENRNEYEANSIGLNDGIIQASVKAAKDYPDIKHVNPENYRVIGTCVASRSSSYFIYMLSDKSASVKIEVNDDACALGTAHHDIILLGYRKEKELEITDIYLNDESKNNNKDLNAVLDQAIDELKQIIFSQKYTGEIELATESKTAHTVRLVKAHYEELHPEYKDRYNFDGTDTALTHNVKPATFSGKTNGLSVLAQAIPSSLFLSHALSNTRYDQFFPTRTDSPKNPAPSALRIERPFQCS